MSRASVRAAIASFLQPPAVDGLNAVYPSLPVYQPGESFFSGPGQASGASAFLFIEREREHLRATEASYRQLVYQVAIVVEFFWVSAGTVGGGGGEPGVQAMEAYDAIVEGIKARVRSDYSLGGGVFTAGTGGELGQDDLQLDSDLPTQIGPDIGIRGALRLTVTEILKS